MAVVSANRLELLQIADAVAREKVIDRQIVIEAMEEAIAKAARSRYGAETDVHAEIDPKSGALRLSRLDFDAVDERPVDLVFLLLLPTAEGGNHLNALACVARKLRDPETAAALRGARDAAGLHASVSARSPSNV